MKESWIEASIMWLGGSRIRSRAFLKFLVWLSIAITLALAGYIAVTVNLILGLIVLFLSLLIAPLVYLVLAIGLSIVTAPFRHHHDPDSVSRDA